MMLIKSYVASSGIHGNGLFAGEDIKRGQKIWEFMEGLEVVIPAENLDRLPDTVRDYLECYTYPHQALAGKLVLDGDHGRFMNHSEMPNTDFKGPSAGYAIQDIPAGTELTCNYRDFVPNFVPYEAQQVMNGIALHEVRPESSMFTEAASAPA